MAVKSTWQIVLASMLLLVAAACGSSPTSPSATSGVSESAAFAFGDSASQDRGLAARPGSEFCEYPDLQVSAAANGSVLDGSVTVLAGAFTGVHRYGTMDGTVAISVTTQNVLRNRQLEIEHSHMLTLADGSFTAAGRSLLRPVSGETNVYQLRERLPITGGTNIFLDATGELRLDGTYDRSSGTMQYRMTGQICRSGRVSP